MLDVSGRWINDTGFAGGITGALYINGGSVSLSAFNLSEQLSYDPTTQIVTAEDHSGSIVLQPGSIIDVSSGGYVGTSGKLAVGSDGLPEGKGGNLSLATYAGSWVGNAVASISLSPNANYAPQIAAAHYEDADGPTEKNRLGHVNQFLKPVFSKPPLAERVIVG